MTDCRSDIKSSCLEVDRTCEREAVFTSAWRARTIESGDHRSDEGMGVLLGMRGFVGKPSLLLLAKQCRKRELEPRRMDQRGITRINPERPGAARQATPRCLRATCPLRRGHPPLQPFAVCWPRRQRPHRLGWRVEDINYLTGTHSERRRHARGRNDNTSKVGWEDRGGMASRMQGW